MLSKVIPKEGSVGPTRANKLSSTYSIRATKELLTRLPMRPIKSRFSLRDGGSQCKLRFSFKGGLLGCSKEGGGCCSLNRV